MAAFGKLTICVKRACKDRPALTSVHLEGQRPLTRTRDIHEIDVAVVDTAADRPASAAAAGPPSGSCLSPIPSQALRRVDQARRSRLPYLDDRRAEVRALEHPDEKPRAPIEFFGMSSRAVIGPAASHPPISAVKGCGEVSPRHLNLLRPVPCHRRPADRTPP